MEVERVIPFCFELNVFQSVEVRKPLVLAVAVAMEKVHWPDEDAMARPLAPDVAKENPVVEAYGMGRPILVPPQVEVVINPPAPTDKQPLEP